MCLCCYVQILACFQVAIPLWIPRSNSQNSSSYIHDSICYSVLLSNPNCNYCKIFEVWPSKTATEFHYMCNEKLIEKDENLHGYDMNDYQVMLWMDFVFISLISFVSHNYRMLTISLMLTVMYFISTHKPQLRLNITAKQEKNKHPN